MKGFRLNTGLKDSTKWEQLTKKERFLWLCTGKTKEEWSGKEIYIGDTLRMSNFTILE